MAEIDKPGSFYLGRPHDLANGKTAAEPLLYDSKDLTTHAVCVGMTGSGKTGLCLALLEEAALDGIPAIAIDPKGDLGNLLLAFPESRAERFPAVDRRERSGPASRCRPTNSRPARPSCGATAWPSGTKARTASAVLRRGRPRDLHARLQRRHSAHRAEIVCRAAGRARRRRRRVQRASRVGDVGPAGAAGHRRRSGPQPRAHFALERCSTRRGGPAATSTCGN